MKINRINRKRVKWREFTQTKAYLRLTRLLNRHGFALAVTFNEADPPEAVDVFIVGGR